MSLCSTKSGLEQQKFSEIAVSNDSVAIIRLTRVEMRRNHAYIPRKGNIAILRHDNRIAAVLELRLRYQCLH